MKREFNNIMSKNSLSKQEMEVKNILPSILVVRKKKSGLLLLLKKQ
jgi:hypothetical protein